MNEAAVPCWIIDNRDGIVGPPGDGYYMFRSEAAAMFVFVTQGFAKRGFRVCPLRDSAAFMEAAKGDGTEAVWFDDSHIEIREMTLMPETGTVQ